MSEKGFLGAGMKFPPQINKATGRFVVSSEEESVKESVYLILMTQQTERFLRPEFGSNLMSYTFMDINVTSVNMMIRDLTEQILKQEPRVQDVEITTDSRVREGCLLVNIDYTVRSSHVRDSLVFPFYLNAAAEEEAYEPEQYESEELE
ncbi:MAG: GPW/gp25 family protein [Acetatifactor sp.]|nr:GPW/gp25 family protein [Acetatifactor sp.]MDE6640491.1 GPW/gp25 family protein [Acetatifactor sp.]